MTPLVPQKMSPPSKPLPRVAVFGSTGSVGTTTLEVLSKTEELSLVALFAQSSVEAFVKQVVEHQPDFAGLADMDASREAQQKLHGIFQGKWLGSEEEIIAFASSDEYDIQVAAVVGVEGIKTSLPAFASGKRVALANKESLVVGGQFFRRINDNPSSGYIVPVDSEHSSLFRLYQLLDSGSIAKFGLTASGGPFYRYSTEQLASVTVEQALQHPTWSMGPRITIDSATMMNKAFELIEAKWLFDIPSEKIEVKIQPQSIFHGYLECSDGSQFFHASPPDMAFPVAYALHFPETPQQVLSPFQNGTLELLCCDEERFSALRLAREVTRGSEGESLRFYIGNEIAAQAFLREELPFNKIVDFVDYALQSGGYHAPDSPAELFGCVAEERSTVLNLLQQFC